LRSPHWESPDLCDGEPWYFVEGIQLDTAGNEVARRQVVIRARTLQIGRPTSFSA
jgi:hypothetical protein